MDANHPHTHTFHLLQVDISAQPAHTSVIPASAAHAQPGMHRNSSSNPALMSTQPSSFHNPSAGGPGASHWLYGRYLTFRMADSPASLAMYAVPFIMMRFFTEKLLRDDKSVTFIVYKRTEIV